MTQLRKILRFYGRFLVSFSRIGFLARRLTWQPLRADFSGQTWLVTGASAGIGMAIAIEAARHGATVVLVARSASRLKEVRDLVPSTAGGALQAEVADLSLRSDVEALVDRLAGQRVDVLVNNVGVLLDDFSRTDEGLETSLATNLVNHFLLTERLLERELLSPTGLVINMSSGGMYNAPMLVGAMNMDERNYNGVMAYGLHKRAQCELTNWWRRRHAGSGPAFYVMHPGWADTAGVRRSLPRFRKLLHPVLRNERDAADTAIWLAATRPQQSSEDSIWFDRAPRSQHVYAGTRENSDPVESLVAFLRSLSNDGADHDGTVVGKVRASPAEPVGKRGDGG
jgi:dehydrogenase/reductase SDR family protein 12